MQLTEIEARYWSRWRPEYVAAIHANDMTRASAMLRRLRVEQPNLSRKYHQMIDEAIEVAWFEGAEGDASE